MRALFATILVEIHDKMSAIALLCQNLSRVVAVLSNPMVNLCDAIPVLMISAVDE